MRLIDADVLGKKKFLIREFKELIKTIYQKGWNDAIDAIIENEPSIEPQKWIPCSERLPKENGEYLVTTKDGEVCQDHFQFLCQWDDCGNDVVAWMEMPTPL